MHGERGSQSAPSGPNLIADHGLAGLGVLGVETVTLAVQAGCAIADNV